MPWMVSDKARLVPAIWARYVLHRSEGWTRSRIDRTFFGASSAFFRYYDARNPLEVRGAKPVSENPFLQIDSCWPGTFRCLAHPYRLLLSPVHDLRLVHRAMLLAHPKLRRVLFAGSVSLRRRYAPPKEELNAIGAFWRSCNHDRLREHFFFDVLCATLAWTQEAAIIGDRERLKPLLKCGLPGFLGLSFEALSFLEAPFAQYMDRWLQVCLIEQLDLDAYRWFIDHEVHDYAQSQELAGKCSDVLELAGLRSAIFEGRTVTDIELLEHLMRLKLPRVRGTGPSWDRSHLLVDSAKTRKKSSPRGRAALS